MQKHSIVLLTLATTAGILIALVVVSRALYAASYVVSAFRRAPMHAQSASTPVGQTATRLADGRWLFTGGASASGPVAAATIVDPVAQTTIPLVSSLGDARAWHSATLLSTRQVLIVGGIGPSGQALATAEVFDPDTETFTTIPLSTATSRAGHTGTLLTDGRVLIAGGATSAGDPVTHTEFWNVDAETIAVAAGVTQARSFHVATLLSDGRVYMSGGTDANGQAVAVADMFNPATSSVGPWLDAVQDPDGPPTITEAHPADAASDVPLDAFVTLRVSRVLSLDNVTDRSVVLSGPRGPVPARVFGAEDGRLVFVRPFDPLEPSTTYSVTLTTVVDRLGVPLAASPITFTTVNALSVDPELWVPDDSSFDHQWVSHRPPSPWQTLAPLQAEPGTTAVSGHVLTLDGRPLPDVTIEVDDARARTDSTGRFLVRLPAGPTAHKELVIDGRSVVRPNHKYGLFEYGLTVESGRTTVLPFTVWMPLLDTAHEVTIPSPTVAETVITSPYIPGLELHLPRGTVVRDEDGEIVTTIGITPIPIDRPPFPLANGVDVPVYFTVQPGSAYVETAGPGPKGAWLVYPNYHHNPPGQRLQFFHYDPDGTGWYVYGLGTVTANGAQVAPDSTTRIYELTGAMINDGNSPPGREATPGGGTIADPVDPSTGVFLMHKTDLELPDVIPIALTRIYNSGDSFARPFGTGMSHPYAMFLWSAEQYQEADLILPEGGRIHFVRTSAGRGFDTAVFAHQETPTLSATPTAFYKAVMRWNGNGWDVRLTDGTVYVFGENAPLQAIRDRFGNTVTIAHTGGRQSGNVTQVTSPSGRWIAFTYDANNRITQAQDNIGRTVRYTYDANGNLSTVTDPENNVTTYAYTAANQLATIRDGRGIVYLTNQYQDGRVVEQTLADPAARYQFAYTLDAAGNVTRTEITDPRGSVERLTFNADHYVTEDAEAVGTPEQRVTAFERQAGTNHVTATVDTLGRRTTYVRTAVGYVQSITRLAGTADAVTTTLTYEPTFNQVRTVVDPLNHIWTVEYDAAGRLLSARDPLSHETTFSTDSAGNVTRVTNPLQHTWQIGHSGGDQTSIANPLGAVWQGFVDSAGRMLTTTDPLGRVTRTEFDALDRVTAITDAAGGQTTFAYDPNGRLTSLTDALSHSTAYMWDASNRLQARTDPLQNSESYRYDGLDNLVGLTDRKGQITAYGYDVLNRLTLVTYADNSTTQYVYDAGDRLIQVVDSIAGAITREYDALDRVTSESTPEGTIAYAYDADGRRITMTVAGQSPVTYGYDAAHRPIAIAQGSDIVSIAYDDAGRRSALILPNGIVAAYGYNAANQLTSLTYTAGTATLGDLTYTYDLAGNPTGVGGSWARTGLPAALSDAQYDAANRLTTWNGQSMSYDLNGNLTADGGTAYTWNARNQLTALSGASVSAFQYDGIGRRRAKLGTGAVRFLYDRSNIVQELSGTAPIANLLTGGIDETFQRADGNGAESLLTDALGSTVALADPSGLVRTRYRYDPFGATSVSGAPSANRAQYTGRENDSNGLYYYRARYYDPRRPRFLSEDPMGFGGGDPNLYAYVGGMPTRSTDPFGQYNRDVHYDLTRGTALQVGMCPADAETIAHADQGVDDDAWTSPMPPENVDARAWFHFTTAERRERLRREAFGSGSRSRMGVYLHALQDSFSHQLGRKDRDGTPYGPVAGHLLDGSGPDNPRNRPVLWRRMLEKTGTELWEFHRLYPVCQ